MTINTTDLVGLTVPPPQESLPTSEEGEEGPSSTESAPLPPEQGTLIDELA